MNVAYNENSASDVAKMFGVSYPTVTSWCRLGYIKATNVSDGSKNARWLISDSEVQRISDLIDRHGARMWMVYSGTESVEEKVDTVVEKHVAEIVKPVVITTKVEPSEDFVDLYWKIKEAKEELENVIARKNQLENLLADYEKQLFNAI